LKSTDKKSVSYQTNLINHNLRQLKVILKRKMKH